MATSTLHENPNKIKKLFYHFFITSILFIDMGRHKKYITDDEINNAIREKSMRYYWKNVKKIQKRNLKKYHENKRNIQNNQQS